MEFSERLVVIRKCKGLSQEALAEAVGVSRQAVSKWETGEAKPDADRMVALCNVLDISMDYLCLGIDLPEVQPEEPEQPQIPPAKKLPALLIAGCTIAALLIGLIISIGISSPPATPPEAPVTDLSQDASVVLNTMAVAYAKAEKTDPGVCDIQVLLSGYPEDLTVSLIVADTSGSTSPRTIPCTVVNNICSARVSLHGKLRYDVAVQLALGDATTEIPLLRELYVNASGCGYFAAWDQLAAPVYDPLHVAALNATTIVTASVQNVDQGLYNIQVLLGNKPEDAAVSLLVENIFGFDPDTTIPCSASGHYQIGSISLADGEVYRVTLLLTLGKDIVRIPLMNMLQADGVLITYEPVWDGQ